MKCRRCHNSFTKKYKTQKFCSYECQNREKSKIARINRVKYKNPRYRYICDFCNKEFYAKDKKGYKKVYCSNECSHKASRKYVDIPDCLENSHRKIDKNIGYVRIYVPMHREANTWGYVYEHRVIAEQMLGRDLFPEEVVHHKNGLRWDNRPENLEVMDKYQHGRLSSSGSSSIGRARPCHGRGCRIIPGLSLQIHARGTPSPVALVRE